MKALMLKSKEVMPKLFEEGKTLGNKIADMKCVSFPENYDAVKVFTIMQGASAAAFESSITEDNGKIIVSMGAELQEAQKIMDRTCWSPMVAAADDGG